MKMKRIPCFFLLLAALAFPVLLTAQGPSAESEIDVEVTPDVVYGHKGWHSHSMYFVPVTLTVERSCIW